MSALDRLALMLGRAAAWCFAAIVLVMVYEVVARYAFGAPTRWAHEVSVALAAIGFVLGGAYCAAEGTHMRVELLVERRPVLARLSHWLGGIAGVIYLGGLAYAAWRMADRAIWRFSLDGSWDPERSGSTLNSPLPAFLKGLLLVGAVLFLLVVLAKLLPRRER
ncbi:MAG: TRAP transporter small permease [Pseudomonadota bacterium]